MKSKSALRLCLSLFLCFGLLTGADAVQDRLLTLYPEWFSVLLEAAALLLPTGLLYLFMPRGEKYRPKMQPLSLSGERLGFIVCVGLSITLLRFLLDYVVFRFSTDSAMELLPSFLPVRFGNSVSVLAVLAVIVVPAFFEEVYLRGHVQTFLSEYISTRQTLLLMALIGSMLYGSLPALPGGFVLSLSMSWLAFAFGSYWYAVLAHIVSNALYLFLDWLLQTFSVYGLLRVLPALAGIGVLLFAYIALRLAERLMLRQSFKKLRYVHHSDYSLTKFAGNAAAVAFLFAFIAKAVIGII
ncbi:MAG: CPBP family intramembrane glutamic endopeptidase [Butyricicoccus sp.]|nr:CPBP family intramembrane glutamic endopeptidase [Butyricicoccus sp.]